MPFAGIVLSESTSNSRSIIQRLEAGARHHLGEAHTLKVTPECRFIVDGSSLNDFAATDSACQHYVGKKVAAVLDGSIHNFPEYCAELSAHFDTVLLESAVHGVCEGYRIWGERVFEKLIGDWSIALRDSISGRLLLSRDFPGARTLYYSRIDKGFAWSTELELLHYLAGDSDIDRTYLLHYLTVMHGSNRTPFKGITQVEAGCGIEFQAGSKVRPIVFYDLKTRFGRCNWSMEDCATQFKEIFHRSVRDRLEMARTQVAHLSGGHDSSSIVSVARAVQTERTHDQNAITTVNILFDDPTSEVDARYADIVSRHVRFSHVSISQLDCGPWFRCVSDVPFSSTPLDFTQFPEALAKICTDRRAKLLLSGAGGDTIGVSSIRPLSQLADLWQSRQLWRLWRTISKAARDIRISPWKLFREDVIRHREQIALALSTGSFHGGNDREKSWAPWIVNYEPPDSLVDPADLEGLSYSQQNLFLQFKFFEHALAQDSYAFLRPVRMTYPFLDRRLIELCCTIPLELKVSIAEPRKLQKYALRDCVPIEVIKRTHKSTIGVALIRQIRRDWKSIQRLVSDDSRLAQHGVLDLERFRYYLNELRDGKRLASSLPAYKTLCLELWLRRIELPQC